MQSADRCMSIVDMFMVITQKYIAYNRMNSNTQNSKKGCGFINRDKGAILQIRFLFPGSRVRFSLQPISLNINFLTFQLSMNYYLFHVFRIFSCHRTLDK